jgi:hypothetical protein
MKDKWKLQPGMGISTDNYVLEGKDFFISYNPDTGSNGLKIFAGDGSGEEKIHGKNTIARRS